MENRQDLTLNQGKVLDFLEGYILANGYPPTLREIAAHFGLKGPKAPQKTLQILEKKGFIRRTPGGSRAVELLNSGLRKAVAIDNETVSVPILGRVRAGEPVLALENIEGYVRLDRSLVSSDQVFLLRVQGDSMIEAHIQDGDFAMVRPQASAENGDIVVALIEDEATIKRIFRKRDLIQLEPANQALSPIVVKKGEKRVTVVGKVVGIFRKL